MYELHHYAIPRGWSGNSLLHNIIPRRLSGVFAFAIRRHYSRYGGGRLLIFKSYVTFRDVGRRDRKHRTVVGSSNRKRFDHPFTLSGETRRLLAVNRHAKYLIPNDARMRSFGYSMIARERFISSQFKPKKLIDTVNNSGLRLAIGAFRSSPILSIYNLADDLAPLLH
ncbi:RNase H domain-containing protein [Aphis craccivora]|uniref:RNase H domain-containing protein n=1 Tax=Aphis craccivora TaxID=307492 RepID=A0A6G0YVL2_APHCR|nr:RNase H domain-containing protein [Aphis craccivora]